MIGEQIVRHPVYRRYGATQSGHIVRIDTQKQLKPQSNGKGYQRVTLSINGVRVDQYVHRFVCETFHGPAPDGHECRHKDGNRANNASSNLAWATKAENEADKFVHGTNNAGVRHGLSVLTDEIVASARLEAARGRQIDEIAKELNVHSKTLRSAVRGDKWNHITDVPPVPARRKPLSPQVVDQIRGMLGQPDLNNSEIARRLGVS